MDSEDRLKAVVTGAGGFIGNHMVNFLKDRGYWVRGVDLHPPHYEVTQADEFKLRDLRDFERAHLVTGGGIDEVYHFAADMGGIGYISLNHALNAHNNSLMDLNMLKASTMNQVGRFVYASSACVYPQHLQDNVRAQRLTEASAIPADPEEGYGWEKLFAEQLCKYYRQDYGLETRIARFHNVYGPQGTYEGGREKAPAAICRKVVLADNPGEIVIWGNGEQSRSFIHVSDLILGVYELMKSDYNQPVNLGSDVLISIEDLAELIIGVSGKKIQIVYDLSGPVGVAGRNSDNAVAQWELGFTPNIPLIKGLAETYSWIEGMME